MVLDGLVLCGGNSSRMGKDKGTLIKNKHYWSVLVQEKLKPYCNRVYISINKSQFDLYATIFDTYDLIIDNEIQKGPLSGIKAFSDKKTFSNLLIMPCDMIDFDEKYVLKLIKTYKKESEKACFSFIENDYLQPFPCIIKQKILEEISIYEHGIYDLLIKNNVHKLSLKNKNTIFLNYNKPEEIK